MPNGLIEFVTHSFTCKRLKNYEPICSESSKYKILKKKWICFSIHRSLSMRIIKTLFEEMNKVISKV